MKLKYSNFIINLPVFDLEPVSAYNRFHSITFSLFIEKYQAIFLLSFSYQGDNLSQISIGLVMRPYTIIFINYRETSQGIYVSPMKYNLQSVKIVTGFPCD